MSFILDALKKLEDKRHRSSVPNLLTVHDSPPEKNKKSTVWVYLLGFVLLLNAGILLTWLHPWRSEKTDIAKTEITTNSDEVLSKKEDTMPGKPAVKQTNVESQSEKVQSKTPITATNKPVLPPFVKKERADALPVKERTSFIQPQDVKSLQDVSVDRTSHQRVIERNELPPSVQQELSNISVTGHIYSNDSSSRIANINGQILREGETVTAGLKLEEITENGVVLSYKGYRFRMRGF